MPATLFDALIQFVFIILQKPLNLKQATLRNNIHVLAYGYTFLSTKGSQGRNVVTLYYKYCNNLLVYRLTFSEVNV